MVVALFKHLVTSDCKSGLVEKHTSQLFCACSEDAARDAMWAGSLARVNMFLTLAAVKESPQVLVACIFQRNKQISCLVCLGVRWCP